MLPTVTVIGASGIGLPSSSTNLPVMFTSVPTGVSSTGSIVNVTSSFPAMILSTTGSASTVSLPAVTVTLFTPGTTSSIGTVNVPFSSVVVGIVSLFTVTFTGKLGIGLPSSSVTLPVMFPGWFGVLFSGSVTSMLAFIFSTLAIDDSCAPLYVSSPRYSALTSLGPSLSVGKVAR